MNCLLSDYFSLYLVFVLSLYEKALLSWKVRLCCLDVSQPLEKHLQWLNTKLTHPLGHNWLSWIQILNALEIFYSLHQIFFPPPKNAIEPAFEVLVSQSESCHLIQELQQKEQQWKRRCEELQVQIQQLQEDREVLESKLRGSHAQEGMYEELFLFKWTVTLGIL